MKEILQPMETFTPIAMKCTQEQFEVIRPKLDKLKSLRIFMFNKNWNSFYLALFEDGRITNGLICSSNGKVHEEWDEELFLKACGIEAETLQEKQTRLTNELNEVNRLIEEENKPKVGDWLRNYNTVYKYNGNENYDYVLSSVKITDQDLIKKLNELIK